ncbi:bacteriophytochrome [Cellvibrio zantedeschiae]|uniref:histidine kinase n=1 Tax=Cellvibrio zantedeschiae TaxID=1237077 RepID=A0ABQ3B5T4_9GAMM|nr:ATP-binding protein [Cellvibrio zantedeschiae]GGY80978.1 bacteriophytochrome [Cellvibrio zantedeschiae]
MNGVQELPTLANCASEPIHIPGSIQPHGAMLVLNLAQELIGWSANSEEMLNLQLCLGAHINTLKLDEEIYLSLQDFLGDLEEAGSAPVAVETAINQKIFDVVIHTYLDRVIIEFETREQTSDEVASFALKAHRGIDRLKRQKSINTLLQMAVEEVQKLTGFDRVMAYIFRHDDSGDVVAEKHSPGLHSYLGRRYPASDIPAQARRLYTLNTLRLIADIGYTPVSLVGKTDEAPLDMSYCVLRSVSPIHIEYLRNMGIGASMSVSIIINGRLWGMLACHHMSPRQIPYSIRMACDVLAQIIAATVSNIQEHERTEATRFATSVRTALMETLIDEDDITHAIGLHAQGLKNVLGADALIVAQNKKMEVFGDIPQSLAENILENLPTDNEDLVLWQARNQWPENLQEPIKKWVGLLALRFDPSSNGWLIALRVEQIETINWGGDPEKDMKPGPLGARLTPNGSFEEWKQVVRDTSIPWDSIQLDSARELLNALLRSSNRRHAEIDRARTQLMAILGHDLRDPLNNINIAAHLLEQASGENKMGTIIRNSSSRMQRLIEQVLDMSRIGTGIGLSIKRKDIDVASMIRDLISETRLGYPGSDYQITMPDSLMWHLDPDRLAQAVGNLLSNARHHCIANTGIHLNTKHHNDNLIIEVRNEAPEIDPEVVERLFSPFKKSSSTRGRTGLGLGLYISHEIIKGHGGELVYEYQEPHVVFRINLPMHAA